MNITLSTVTPENLKELLKTTPVFYGYHQVPAGTLFVCILNNSVIAAAFCDDTTTVEDNILKNFPDAQPCDAGYLAQFFTTPTVNITITGTEFQNKVWQAAIALSAGTTVTYQELATQLNNPKAFRAVANALGDNKVAYFIPCHRIVRTNGDLGGYRWGIDIKAALLEQEKQLINQ